MAVNPASVPNAVHVTKQQTVASVPVVSRRVMWWVTLVLILGLSALSMAGAQSPAELEARLPSLSGLERARALGKLVNAHKVDRPEDALRFGREALSLFKTYPDPAANVSTLAEMLWPFMTAGRYDSATFYADSARRFANRIGDRSAEARAISNLGTLAQRMGEPDRAVQAFGQALALQRPLGNTLEIANSLNNLGFVYSTDLADYGKSLSYHLEALALRQRGSDTTSIALSLNNIGIVYGRLRQFDEAMMYFDRALRLRRQIGNKPRIASTLNNIGDAYFDKGDYPRALDYQQQALALRAASGDRSAIALSHRNIGLVYLAMHKLDLAQSQLSQAMSMASAVGDKGLIVQINLALSRYERERGAPASAVTHARDALAIADSMPSRELVRQATAELAAGQEAQGQLGDALLQLRRSQSVSDSIFSAETTRRIATLEQQYDDERRLRELDSLRHTQSELELKATARAFQRDAAAGLAILIAVVAFFLYRRRVEGARIAESLSVTDALTGLRNRRYVQQTIEMDIAASLRRCRAAAVRGAIVDDADLIFLMMDVDHFKSVNDAHGHSVGDQLLVQIGAVLRATCRDSDVAVRWGGDEFLIIARFTDRNQGAVTAERLRLAVERHATVLPSGEAIRVTCSIGFAAFPLDPGNPEASSWQDVVAMADQAAYSAKRAGRNTWAAANPQSLSRL